METFSFLRVLTFQYLRSRTPSESILLQLFLPETASSIYTGFAFGFKAYFTFELLDFGPKSQKLRIPTDNISPSPHPLPNGGKPVWEGPFSRIFRKGLGIIYIGYIGRFHLRERILGRQTKFSLRIYDYWYSWYTKIVRYWYTFPVAVSHHLGESDEGKTFLQNIPYNSR